MREPVRLTVALVDEPATRRAGALLAGALAAVAPDALFVTLGGELGTGKTTLARGLLAALGVHGAVRSPSYTLVESYPLGQRVVHHLDWYRLAGAEELDGLGWRDLCGPGQWLLVEWPERVAAVAAGADLAVALAYEGNGRRLDAVARTPAGTRVLVRWKADSALE